MAASSLPRARFLAFGDISAGRPDDRVYVTIPAWSFRATAPLIPRRGLDLFQRVVLALCQAGVRAPDRLHELTRLDARLCAYVIDQSRKEGLLDGTGNVTDLGRAVLRSGTVDNDTEWAVHYVFYDPVTGYLWPRTVGRLPDAEVVEVTAKDVVVDLGTAGRPGKVRALRMRMDGVTYGSPSRPRRSSKSYGATGRRASPRRWRSSHAGTTWARCPISRRSGRCTTPAPPRRTRSLSSPACRSSTIRSRSRSSG